MDGLLLSPILLQYQTKEHFALSNRARTESVSMQAFTNCILVYLSRLMGKSLDPESPEEKEEEKRGFTNNGFNQFRSDRISLDREVPDTRDPR